MLHLALLASLVAPQESLFNGHTLDGWRGDSAFWSVEDGAIVGRSTESTPCARTTYLLCEAPPCGDFELRAEFWIDGGNSGIQFRSALAGLHEVTGYQADLEDSPNWTGGIYETGGRGILVRRGTDTHCEPDEWSATALDPAPPDSILTPRAWHSYHVAAFGNEVVLSIDGHRTCRLVDDDPAGRRAGAFALQLHKGPPMEVRFRNIELTRLDADAPEPVPHWIWAPVGPDEEPAPRTTLIRRFEAPAGVVAGRLFGSCDNEVELLLDGEVVARSDDWTRPFELELPPKALARLAADGEHELRARCRNTGGPGGFVARLTLTTDEGSTTRLVTDGRWTVEGSGARAVDLGRYGSAPWGLPVGRSPGHSSSKTSGAPPELPVELPPGFEAEILFEVPEEHGPWHSLVVGRRNQVVAAGDALFALDLEDPSPRVEPLELGLQEVRALCLAQGDLFVIANHRGRGERGLFRVHDTDLDGRFDDLRFQRSLDTTGRRGIHGVGAAPGEERLYIVAGHDAAVPHLALWELDERFHDDRLIPSIDDPSGNEDDAHAHGGWIASCNLEGRAFRVVAAGLTDPWDLACDADGHAFTYDADPMHDAGAPWYRAPRVLHVTLGEDFGWRRGTGKLTAEEWEIPRPVCVTGPARPTGLVHGKDGGFHGGWADRLYCADALRGAVHAIDVDSVEPSYAGRARPFLSWRGRSVSDLAWLDDGSMLALLNAPGWPSQLLKIRSTVARAEPFARETDARHATEDGLRLFERSASLRTWGPRTAQLRGPVPELPPQLLSDPATQARLIELCYRLKRPLVAELTLSIARFGPPEDARRLALFLERALSPHEKLEVRHELPLLRLMTALDGASVAPETVARLVRTRSQEDAFALALLLPHIKRGWNQKLAAHAMDAFEDLVRTSAMGANARAVLEQLGRELRAHFDEVAPGWAPPKPPTWKRRPSETLHVRTWVADDVRALVKASPGEGDAARGARAFERARCWDCHSLSGSVHRSGPILGRIGASMNRLQLLEAILEPSHEVWGEDRQVQLWTSNGEVLAGSVTSRKKGVIALRPPPDPDSHRPQPVIEVPAAKVLVERPWPRSPMPRGTLDPLDGQQILDLLAYLEELQ